MKQIIVLFFTLVVALAHGISAQGIDISSEVTRLNGDVNGDGAVGITDVTDLIDYLLGKAPENFITANADVDGDNSISIADVTTLIDVLLEVPSAQPTLTVTPTAYDMGNVPVGTRKSADISLTGVNLTDPITVSIAETHGGEFTVNKTSLPATGGTVIVTYSPEGAHSSSLQLIFKSGTKTAKVVVSGKGVQPTIMVVPDTLYFDDNPATKSFTVRGTNLQGDLTLSPNNSWIAVNTNTITSTQAASGKTVTATISPSSVGNRTGYIAISSLGAEEVRVVVICQPSPSITVAPTSCDFGVVNLGSSVTKAFTVRGTNTTGTLKVTSTETMGGQFTVSPTTLPSTGGTVRVTFNPTVTGSHAGLFTITSTTEGVSARASYTGKSVSPTPMLTVTPTSLTFDNVNVGDCVTKTFLVKGNNLIDGVTIVLNGTNSSLYSISPITITPNEAAAGKTVKVTYCPSTKGTHTATVRVSSSGATSKNVNFTGTAVPQGVNPY